MSSEERLRKAVAECVGQPIVPLAQSDALLVPLYAFASKQGDLQVKLNLAEEKIRTLKRQEKLRQVFSMDVIEHQLLIKAKLCREIATRMQETRPHDARDWDGLAAELDDIVATIRMHTHPGETKPVWFYQLEKYFRSR